MANAIITPDIIAKEGLMHLENNLGMAMNVHRDYKREYTKVGETVSIRRPVKFDVTDGATVSIQDVEEATTSITVDQQKHIAWEFTSKDLTLSIEEYSERYIKPAAIALANKVDADLHSLYSSVWNSVGTPGTTPADYDAVSDVAQRMDEMAVPADRRCLMLNPAAGHKVAGTATALYMSKVAEDAYRRGAIGSLAGLETYKTQNVKTHTVGALGGTPLVNGASQNDTYAAAKNTNTSSLATDGWSNSVTGVLKAGDVFTIAGVFAVNPVPGEGSKDALPYLQQFTVTADADSNGSGQATLTVAPAIISSGPFQTVSAAPADNAAITVLGTAATGYSQNLGFHKNAFALVACPMEMPDGASWKAQESKNGLSMRVIKEYDFTNDKEKIRLDILYGKKSIYPDLACRLWG